MASRMPVGLPGTALPPLAFRCTRLVPNCHWYRSSSSEGLQGAHHHLCQLHKTAFSTNSGQLFEFQVLPFTLCNAPTTFTRPMNTVLMDLAWEICLAYLDDNIVYGHT